MDIISSKEKSQVKNKYVDKLFYVAVLFLLFIFALRDWSIINIPSYVYLVFVSIVFIFCDKTKLITLLIVLPFASTGFQYVYALCVGMVVFAIKFSRNITIKSNTLMIALFLAIEICRVFIFHGEMREFIRWGVSFLFLIYLFVIEKDDIDFVLLIRTFSIFITGVCLIIFGKALQKWNYNVVEMFNKGYRLGSLIGDNVEGLCVTGNSNGLGIYCNIAITLELLLLIKGQSKNKLANLICIVLLSVIGLLTLSRAFLLVYAFVMLYALLISKVKIRNKIVFVLAFILLLGISFAVIKSKAPYIIDNFLARFSEEDISNGRVDGWNFYWDVLLNNFDWMLFGIGGQNILDILATRGYVFSYVPHNGIIESLMCYGIIGSVLIVLLIVYMVFEGKEKNRTFHLLQLLPFFTLLVKIQSGQFLRSFDNVIILALAYLVLFCKDGEKINYGKKLKKF